MGFGKLGLWMVRTGIGIGLLYTACSLSFKYGRVYERNEKEGRQPGIAVSRQVTNDFHDMLEEIVTASETKKEESSQPSPVVYQAVDKDLMSDLQAQLEKKYNKLAEDK
jgi:hypothetical protein